MHLLNCMILDVIFIYRVYHTRSFKDFCVKLVLQPYIKMLTADKSIIKSFMNLLICMVERN